ncbi:fimbrial protein [Enterobacillus tribolii]|uniref:Major type 1 subunit fimbrin (Pilin) n=1 Tax=Enterobacillus tribolii TaxID=1487935 RepID=A0A370QQM2_9GAMM|nr:fimbrial protein [Enterobacillus tribolii]MBW7981709.1 fimbrial protein [Enterobacillus tribolii]RDK91088.1 major type 1 subunit fimbrin (pilin) [Enterobacillus tribolii]
MKKNIIAAALVSSVVLSASALAADGTVNFNGEITDEVCTVDSGSKDFTVAMGKIGTNAFSASGSLAGAKQFTITLTDCPASVANNGVAIRFDGSQKNGDNAILDLTSASTAQNVGIQISDAQNQVVKLYENSSKYTVQAGSVKNNLNFTARYISTAATVGAGTANAVSQFTIDYQ